ncbi:hypothetical protein COV24_05145 [candidate division WWE3 bacterium CG10_big_fil_rev_8_21_14_0_10_32_10]|uniref:Glycosyl transferase family 1 domain-containing protein n=1 Tax=candidate division WWE3 bacterium CG10_big_fil_rev_8_21_14_0_10_32_10 TaxID=1975090 RepID=A0A2H0R906_UNCKA|nr:MAG: hypothetical protein COV24_05145 [candidate division WWE3 bacterium CG10_big_fil_rev_8_21_14_0_10_32_10]
MKVGIVVDEMIQGGFQRVALMETIELNKYKNTEAHLVVLKKSNHIGYQEIINKNNVTIDFLDNNLPTILKVNFKFPFFAFFSLFHITYPLLLPHFVKNNYDLYIAHGTYTAFSTIALAKKQRVKAITFIHDSVSYVIKTKYNDQFLGKIKKIIYPITLFADKYIINNSYMVLSYRNMINYLSKINCDLNKCVEIKNGCNSAQKINTKKVNYAIAVTKWDRGKNPAKLINIWKKGKIKTPLKIIGVFEPPSIKMELQNIIVKEKLQNKIQIIGKVSENKLINYYKQAKFLIHPFKEAFGLTILEAAANGCPVIFTKNSGVKTCFNKNILKYATNNSLKDNIGAIKKIENLKKTQYVHLCTQAHNSSKKYTWGEHSKTIYNIIKCQ